VAAGRPLGEVFHLVDPERRHDVAPNPINQAIECDRTVSLAAILISRDGHEAAIEESSAPIHSYDGQLTGAVTVFRDIGAALATSQHMAYLAQHDVLTGLPNRLLLLDRLGEAIARARRRCSLLAVLFLDVDGFKAVNDTLGHSTGDGVLRSIAARLTGVLRQSDTVCRYGGDEFVVLLSEIEHTADALIVASKLRAVVAAPLDAGGREIFVTASIGIGLYPFDGPDAETLISHADGDMYEAKRAGLGTAEPRPREAAPLAGHDRVVWNTRRVD
jgi:diguanylate cyclase (GGDEF)-like protein